MSRQSQSPGISIAGWGRSVRLALLALSLFLVVAAPPALAQQGPTPTADQINTVARELYCPLCNGVRLDTCDLQACIQMRQVIADKLAAGVPKEQIKQEFVIEYGPKVLGEPPRTGIDLLAWIVPIVAIVAGAAWLLVTARRWTRKPAPAAATSDVPEVPVAPGTVAPAGPVTASASDPYLAQVEADLEDME